MKTLGLSDSGKDLVSSYKRFERVSSNTNLQGVLIFEQREQEFEKLYRHDSRISLSSHVDLIF